MAYIEEENQSVVTIVHDNKEFQFTKRSSGVELQFVRTKFRKSSDVTAQFDNEDDIPSSVVTELGENGFTFLGVES